MTKRIFLAGFLGGVALFMWEAVAHMVTPLGDTGIKPLENEPAMIAMVQQNIKEPGFYFFPAPEFKAGMSGAQKRQAMEAAMNKARTGASGILIATPVGTDSLTPAQFGTQFGCDVLMMLLAAFLLSRVNGPLGFARRTMLVGMMALFPVLATEIPYWNWYKFPSDYIAAQFLVHVVGFVVGGAVIALLLKGNIAPVRAPMEMAA